MTSLTRTPATFSIMVDGEFKENQTPETGRWYCGFSCPEWADDPVDGLLAKWDGVEFVDEDGESVDMDLYDYLVPQV